MKITTFNEREKFFHSFEAFQNRHKFFFTLEKSFIFKLYFEAFIWAFEKCFLITITVHHNIAKNVHYATSYHIRFVTSSRDRFERSNPPTESRPDCGKEPWSCKPSRRPDWPAHKACPASNWFRIPGSFVRGASRCCCTCPRGCFRWCSNRDSEILTLADFCYSS